MPTLLDIKAVEKEAQEEIRAEQSEIAKGKIKAKLASIAQAEKVVTTLKLEYAALLKDITLDA